jgi:drug/metabolite transporter (DMT)-like permease
VIFSIDIAINLLRCSPASSPPFPFTLPCMKKALWQLHIAVFLWGFTGVLGRLIDLNEGWLVWYRLLIAAVTLWLLYALRGQRYTLARKDMAGLFLVGGIQAMHWVFFYASIKYANVTIALTCLSATGLFTAIIEPLLTGKKPNLAEMGLGAMAILGIYLIFHFDPQYKTGIALGVLSALFVSFTPVFNKKYLRQYPAQAVTHYNLTGGLLILSAVLPLYLHFFPEGKSMPTPADWGWLLVLGWLCTLFTWHLAMKALQSISAFTMNLVLNLEPVYGILLAFAVFHENKYLSDGFYLGLALIIAAVFVQMWRITRKQ